MKIAAPPPPWVALFWWGFCAFAALFAAESAFADGAAIRTDAFVAYTAADFPNADLAISAAMEACDDANSGACPAVATVTFTNAVYYLGEFGTAGGTAYEGVEADAEAAIAAALEACRNNPPAGIAAFCVGSAGIICADGDGDVQTRTSSCDTVFVALTDESCGEGMVANALGTDCEVAPPSTASTATSGNDNDGNARDLAVVGLGVGVVGFMAAYLSGGDFSLFHFAPDYGYSLTESGYSVNAGGRLNFRKDGWHLYYAAGQENANDEFGDFRYESSGKYAADFWTAAFSETVQGETADYDFSLSADYKGGIWKISPTYRLHSHFADEEFDTQNSLNLEGILRYNRWTISPSAGFNWRRPEEFGDNARFNLSAVRRF